MEGLCDILATESNAQHLEHRNSEKEKTKVPKTKLISRVRKKNPDS